MKKFVAAILSLVGVSCLGAALAACDSQPAYYKLVYENDEAVVVDFRGIQSGAEVREGYIVEFTCALAEGAEGDPVVLVDGVEIYPDRDGVYSFVMSGDKTVTFENAVIASVYSVTFDKGDYRISYNVSGEDAEAEGGIKAKTGEKIDFSIDVSVYYGDSDYTVLANTTVLTPDGDGIYSVTVTGNTNITVTGLELDETFLDRPDGGKGTASEPYLVERPIDLYLMADRVNDDWWNGRYGSAYYKLNADIDMKGEQLFIIGDYISGNYAFFSGEFDGNGKTISNFYIEDSIIEQSAFTQVGMPYIGLFGYVSATMTQAPRIHGLTLKNFTIDVDAASFDQSCSVGGIVGYGVGAEISNCSVSGKIVIDSDDANFSYVGGVIGFQQSAYVSEELKYYSSVNACSADVEIKGESGNLYAAGGIAGYAYSSEEKTASYIINSYSSGTIVGAMNAGGVVGYLSPYASVKNCYSLCEYIEAYCGNGYTAANARFAYAYAGGVVGYADSDSSVSNCFALCETDSYAEAGDKYAFRGDIVGGAGAASEEVVGSRNALISKCYGGKEVSSDKSFYTDKLGWSQSDWSFDASYPEAKPAYGARNITVTVDYGDNKVNGKNTVQIVLDKYLPVSAWYGQEIERFVKSGALRSYGYFFVRENGFSEEIPYSYVLTGGETLYVGFADYSEIAGKYYLDTGIDGSGAYVVLGADGSLAYSYGARNFLSYYTYDGESAVLYNCPALTEQIDENTISYTSGRAVLVDGTLTIVNNVSFTANSPLKAVKEISGFRYGKYYGGSTDYVFNSDGTGRIGSGEITYTVVGSEIVIDNNGQKLTGNISGGQIASVGGVDLIPYDMFEGVWEKSATSHKQFTFDGKGAWKYVYFGYNAQGLPSVISSEGGVYDYNSADDKIILKDENNNVVGQASFDTQGFLDITYGVSSIKYYKAGSYVGVWRYFFKYEAITVALNGISSDGYGTAYVYYETLDEMVEMTYEVATDGETEYIYLYYGDVNYGILSYNTREFTLTGSIYSFALNGVVDKAVFCLSDDFKGVWMSEELNVVEFNGYGSYNLAASDSSFTLNTYGTVKIDGKTVEYKLDNSTMTGSFAYKGVTYKISFDDALGVVNVESENGSFVMMRRDSMYGVELCDNQGVEYIFNGGGSLAEGGYLTAGLQTYKYKVLSDGSIEVLGTDGEKVGAITIEQNVYRFTKIDGSYVELTIRNNFTGEWLIGGGLNRTVKIGKIGADGKAFGEYLGESVVFTYHSDGKYLTFEWENKTLYINSLSAANSVELAISAQNNTFGKFDLCLSEDALDGFRGVYTAQSGEYIVFDGFGNSCFGKGKATLYSADGELVSVNAYIVNKFGLPEFSDGERKVFKGVAADTEGAFVCADKAYIIEATDFLYGVIAEGEGGKLYTFDGVGGITDSDGNSYVYDGAVRNSLELFVTLNVTDSEGKEYDAKIDYSTTDYKFEITEKQNA